MMTSNIALRPSYWASVSGGKDSLYMLKVILHNLDKYPLSGVVHFEMDIDYPFIKDVIDYMESECKRFGIPFLRFKPDHSWEEWYYHPAKAGETIFGFPMRMARWCNNHYKLSAKKKMDDYMRSLGYNVIYYIGYCADEEKRFSKRVDIVGERYPLVEEGINEDLILEWAKDQPIFNNYYKTNRRCGCMYCPMMSKISMAYLAKYYPDNFRYMIEKMKETEQIRSIELGRPFSVTSSKPQYNAEYLEKVIPEKWIPKLEEIERRNELGLWNKKRIF